MSGNTFFQRFRAMFAGLRAAETSSSGTDDGIVRAREDWRPRDNRHRVEIMVTGDPSRVGKVADAIDAMQKRLFNDIEDNLELRITGFLDNCIHRSKWNRKPIKAAAQARQWHCEQSKTKLTDALENSAGEMVDAIVLVGHRFDDEMKETLRQAEKLKEQGVQIHCLHTGSDAESREAYEKLAEETGGVFLQMKDQSDLGEVMPILMAHIRNEESLLTFDPEDTDAKKLRKLLLERSEKP